MEIWRHGDMETGTWRHAHGRHGQIDMDMETWRHRDIETWRHGDIESWRHGDVDMETQTWRYKHGDMDMETYVNNGHEDMERDMETWT